MGNSKIDMNILAKRVELLEMRVKELTSVEPEALNERLSKIEERYFSNKEMLTTTEVAEYLGVSQSQIYKLTMNMEIPHYKPQGKTIYFDKKELLKWMRMMPGAAYIISWNVWQMDGLSYGLPGYEPYIEEKKQGQDSGPSLFDGMDGWNESAKTYEPKPQERFCLIKDFLKGINLQKSTLRNIDFHDKSAIKQTFESLVNNE